MNHYFKKPSYPYAKTHHPHTPHGLQPAISNTLSPKLSFIPSIEPNMLPPIVLTPLPHPPIHPLFSNQSILRILKTHNHDQPLIVKNLNLKQPSVPQTIELIPSSNSETKTNLVVTFTITHTNSSTAAPLRLYVPVATLLTTYQKPAEELKQKQIVIPIAMQMKNLTIAHPNLQQQIHQMPHQQHAVPPPTTTLSLLFLWMQAQKVIMTLDRLIVIIAITIIIHHLNLTPILLYLHQI